MRAFSSDLAPKKFIFYDFECTQVNGKCTKFLVAHSICNDCESEPVTGESTCKNCGSRCHLCDKFNKKEKELERKVVVRGKQFSKVTIQVQNFVNG